MYDVISDIINHTWQSGAGEQQYVYMICGVLVITFYAIVIDLIYRIFRGFIRSR